MRAGTQLWILVPYAYVGERRAFDKVESIIYDTAGQPHTKSFVEENGIPSNNPTNSKKVQKKRVIMTMTLGLLERQSRNMRMTMACIVISMKLLAIFQRKCREKST